ncbi:MAG: radical SAM protein, partial [Oscillospiraceae bacterium]
PEKYDALCHSDFGEKAYAALLKFTKSCVLYVPQVVMTVVDTMPQGEIEDCRKICEDLGAKFRIRNYIKE